MTVDFLNVESVGIQHADDRVTRRIWVCVNGECVLRVRGIKEYDYMDLSRDEKLTDVADLGTGLEQYNPMETAVALALYSYNIDPVDRAQRIYGHFSGECMEVEDLVKILHNSPAYIATELPYPSAVVYVAHALGRYGEEARNRCRINATGSP
jgi:hypothetical protein